MKKILLALAILIVILFAAVYLFIPSKIKIEATATVNAALPAVSRILSENENWKKFWPDKIAFKLDNQTYSIKGKFISVFNIDIGTDKDSIGSILNLLFLKTDVMAITWNSEIQSTENPIKKITQYFKARSIEKNLNSILQAIKSFMEKTENVYGFNIKLTKVKDSVLISTRRSFDHRPGMNEVYEMIRSLKEYIDSNKAKEEGLPMLNIFRIDSTHFDAMTAIPVDRKLALTDKFAPKLLLKGGDILEGDVKGAILK